jgi:hypothetical protein
LEEKVEFSKIFHFSLFQNIFEEFIKRQNIMSQKINSLEVKFDSWSLTHGIGGDTETSNKVEAKPEINEGDINKEESEKNLDIDNNLNNGIIEEKLKELNKKIKKLELLNKEMAQRLVVNNNQNENFVETSEEKIKQMNTNFKNLENIVNQKDRVINNQTNKVNQIMKKIELFETNMEENKKSIKNITSDVFNLQRLKLEDLINEFYKFKNQNEKVAKDLKNLIEEKFTAFKNELLGKNADNPEGQTEEKNITAPINEFQLREMANELKNYFSKNISETNKSLKKSIKDLNIHKINQDISNLQKEIKEKITQKNLVPINIQMEDLENKQIDLKSKNSEIVQNFEYWKERISKIDKIIEYLSSQINSLNQNESHKDKKDKDLLSDEGIKLFVKKDSYEEDMTKILKKMEKILIFQQENLTKIDSIEKKLKSFATDKDIKNIEHYALNMIQEFKIIAIKKFMEKKEAFKSLKLLGLQIKNINEFLNLNNNNISTDRIMICPSCENKISNNQNISKSTKEKNDSKNYRMGQGFSHMLQLINSDLMKSAEKINDDITLRADENNFNNFNDKDFHNRSCVDNKQLPRLNSQKSFSLLNGEAKNNELDSSNNNISSHYNFNENNNFRTLKNNSIDRVVNMKSDIKSKMFKKIEKSSPWKDYNNQTIFTKLKKVK